jgi:hypothetical protein
VVPLSSRFDDDGGEMGTWLLHGTAGSMLNGFLSGEKFTVSFKCLSASRVSTSGARPRHVHFRSQNVGRKKVKR